MFSNLSDKSKEMDLFKLGEVKTGTEIAGLL